MRKITVTLLSLLCTSCAIPNTKMTSIHVNGQILSKQGQVKPGQSVELTLPAEYGLKQIDLDYLTPEELSLRQKTGLAVTDALGTFRYTFKDIPYKTSYWILPPLGNVPGDPETPKFLMRILNNPEATYSLSVEENDITYGVWRSNENKRKFSKPPYRLTGKLLEDSRKNSKGDSIRGWITDLLLKENY